MGIVGISFGSPTAGTGFDVTSTVNQIVANLQNVETPWKTQLTALQAQDTAISGLGTLLSTLSTDVGAFTDFQGVLASKQGSSSDPSVLALTSASSAAIAGTHTIVVNSLAATSSGYLDPITTAADTLSGAISIQVGTGAAHVITVGPTSNTLAGLSAAINAAGIGVTSSVLTDTHGSRLSLVSGASGSAGGLAIGSTITDSTTATALAYNSATTGADASLVVDGVNITSASNTVSTVIPGITFQLLAPSPILTPATGTTPAVAETVQVQVLNDNSSVVSSVSQFVSDYNAIVKSINSQEANSTTGTPQPLFGTPTLNLLQQQLLGQANATSPSGYLDQLTSSHLADTLTGTLSIATGSAAPTVFDLSTLPAGHQNLAGLVTAINAAHVGVSAGIVTNSTGSSLSLTSNTSGPGGKLTVVSAVTDGATTLAYTPLGTVNSLSQLGISVGNDGTLTLDTNALNTQLNSDYASVVGFFQDSNSWGVNFSTALNNLGSSSVTGSLSLALKSNSANETSLNTSIANEERVISTQKDNLTLELTKANEILQAIPSNLDNVSELYSAITGYQAPRF